jgi:CheY-like chemotaxis protein
MATRERPRILVVDDDLVIRATFTNIFDGEGYEVSAAPGGTEAVRLAASLRFDAILLDLFMPEMSGMTALHHLRTLAPGAAIVILSSYVEPDREVEARRLGAAAVLTKPADLEELLDFLHKVTRRD